MIFYDDKTGEIHFFLSVNRKDNKGIIDFKEVKNVDFT